MLFSLPAVTLVGIALHMAELLDVIQAFAVIKLVITCCKYIPQGSLTRPCQRALTAPQCIRTMRGSPRRAGRM